MFFIGIFGGGVKSNELGRSHPRNCPRCHNSEPWIILETSRYFSAFFVTLVRWGRSYIASCPICGETAAITREEALGAIDEEPV